MEASKTHIGFTNMGSEMHIFGVIAILNSKFWFGSPCTYRKFYRTIKRYWYPSFLQKSMIAFLRIHHQIWPFQNHMCSGRQKTSSNTFVLSIWRGTTYLTFVSLKYLSYLFRARAILYFSKKDRENRAASKNAAAAVSLFLSCLWKFCSRVEKIIFFSFYPLSPTLIHHSLTQHVHHGHQEALRS